MLLLLLGIEQVLTQFIQYTVCLPRTSLVRHGAVI